MIRSAATRDLESVMVLAGFLNSYNLPADKTFIKKLLRDKGHYLFVAEEIKTGKVVGCSLIIARHGTPRLPHLSFQLGGEAKFSQTLGKRVWHSTLKLHADTRGFTEIGGLVVLPRYRGLKERIGKQLSFARFAYMARYPKKFERRVLVEYLPKLDALIGNKLWEYLGKRFTELSYRDADRLSVCNKEFILTLFPREKIYCRLLPETAVRFIGIPGPGAAASLGMLSKIGFKFLDQVDPFDGGPHYGAAFSKISLIRETKFVKYGEKIEGVHMVSVEKHGQFRAVVSENPAAAAKILGVKSGERISITPFK